VCLDLHLITPSHESTASDRCTPTLRSASSLPKPPNHTSPRLREELQKEGVAQDSDPSRESIGSGRLGASVWITKPYFLHTKVDELSAQEVHRSRLAPGCHIFCFGSTGPLHRGDVCKLSIDACPSPACRISHFTNFFPRAIKP
jgi:hypothetical protein